MAASAILDWSAALSDVVWIGGAQWSGKSTTARYLGIRHPVVVYAYDFHGAASLFPFTNTGWVNTVEAQMPWLFSAGFFPMANFVDHATKPSNYGPVASLQALTRTQFRQMVAVLG